MEKDLCSLTELILPGRPGDAPWEGCFNRVNYRVPRGTPVLVPRFLAEHIRRTAEEAERAEDISSRLSASAERIGRI
ncbi:MAG: hypothetical protein K6G56_07425 [Clostridiales bacterium]|nr:hypothetical protein [Clostridiales bacterium]